VKGGDNGEWRIGIDFERRLLIPINLAQMARTTAGLGR
jgi:hypothetical protein